MTQTAPDFRIDLEAASLRRQVQEQLRRAIITGFFGPGAHLSDRVLAELFDVSRPLIREAVRQLEAEGLIETVPHRGAFVKCLSPDEARQIYAVRGVLEALAAKNFARAATDAEIGQLQAVFADILALSAEPVGDDIVTLKQKFYDVLLGGADNAYARSMLSQIFNRITQLRATSLSDPARLPRTVAELKRLVEAIVRRDEAAAWAASLEHVENAARVALPILARLWDTRTDRERGGVGLRSL